KRFSTMVMLEFEEVTPIELPLNPEQSSNGTIFLLKAWTDSIIQVLHDGEKVVAVKSWDGEIRGSTCFGDELYFKTDTDKIYTATFHPPSDIQIDFVRDLENGEECNHNMLITRKINGKEVIYRACDDSTTGISMDITEVQLEGCSFQGIHRGKLIYTNSNTTEGPVIYSSPTIILFNCSYGNIIASDDKPLIYFCSRYEEMFVLDTTTMETLSIELPDPVDDSAPPYFSSLIGVRGGEIVVRRRTPDVAGDDRERTNAICRAKFSESLKQFEKAAMERDQQGK
ncbi:hypothetical protein PFISCL1PPCAC_17230, partial [Pristionchus fissidentatus]